MGSEKVHKVNKDLEFWMTNLPRKLRSIPIIHLAIPGSHDSTTFAITRTSKISPDARPVIQYLKFLEPILGSIMSKWSRTQSIDITQQLIGGIRYFDLRIATKPSADGFYFVHNLYSENVNVVLEQIKSFLDSHPKELVILDCQHFYLLNQGDHRRFAWLLAYTFGGKMLPCMSMTHLTLEYTAKFGYQIIVIYRQETAKFGQSFWPAAFFPTPWPDTVSIPKLITCLDFGLKNRDYSVGFVSQCVLTPTVWFAFRYLFSSLRDKCVIPLEQQKYSWLRKQKPGIGGINIVISDFVDYQEYQFPREVIGLNQKLLNSTSDDIVLT